MGMKGISGAMVALILVLAVVIMIGGMFAVLSVSSAQQAAAAIKACPDDYDGSVDVKGEDSTDYATTGTASVNNITLSNFTADGQSKDGYFKVQVSGEICGFDEISLKKVSGATLPSNAVIDVAEVLDETTGDLITSIPKDDDERKLKNFRQVFSDDVITKFVFKSVSVPTANVTNEKAWEFKVEALTDDDDDSATGYVLGGFKTS